MGEEDGTGRDKPMSGMDRRCQILVKQTTVVECSQVAIKRQAAIENVSSEDIWKAAKQSKQTYLTRQTYNRSRFI